MAASRPNTVITRDDLETKLRAFQGDLRGEVADKKQSIVAAGTGIAMVVMIIVFLFGRRSGRKKSTVVQIRRL
jgi:ABC-type glycerol-3-phosphate transport system permease component